MSYYSFLHVSFDVQYYCKRLQTTIGTDNELNLLSLLSPHP